MPDHNHLLNEQRFKALVQHGSDIITILDDELNYTYVSPTSIKVLGISPETFIGRNALEFIHKDDLELVMTEAATLKKITHVQFTPFRIKNLNGDWKWLDTKATNLIDDHNIKGIVCNSNDITEVRNYIDAIEAQNKKLKEISWMQSHLVRGPLTRIMSLVELLKKHQSDDEGGLLLEYLSKSANELDEVIRNIANPKST